MNKAQQKRFESLYRKHLSALKRQWKAETSIDAYSRAIANVAYFTFARPRARKIDSSLPHLALQALRDYWVTHRIPEWLFPQGRNRGERHAAKAHMDRGSTQKSFNAIVQDVGIKKDITLHSLRHCYGTLLTDIGVGLRSIREQIGHECPKTTALYTQFSRYSQTDTDRRINGLLAKLRVKWGE